MMKKYITELSNEEARNFFLRASKFCTIDLPKYFDFQPLLNELEHKIGKLKLQDIKKGYMPNDCEGVNYKFLTNKDGNFAWRPFQILNPAIYICLVNRITEDKKWTLIQNRFEEFRKNKSIKCYSIPLVHDEDYSTFKTDTSKSIQNWWEKIEQQSIELALEYNYVLITDITDCYSSIYTHSISWSLHGKEEARRHRNDNPPNQTGDIIDKIIQAMSYRQTNGIPQGSVLMDFIAEMVLGYADLQLSKKINELKMKNLKYQILRYRDDYRIFANTQEDAVKIAKLLSEVLADLNLKLNIHKTFVSNSIIHDTIKPDKWYWNEAKQKTSTLQKHLLLIHGLANKYPNSGSLSTALSGFLDRLYPLSILNEERSRVLVSILIDIAYNNPRTYSLVIVCIGKILSIEPDKVKVEEIYELINKKFESKPNVGYWEVWFQRLMIKAHSKIEFKEPLCKIAQKNNGVNLWNNDWLKDNYKKCFQECNIINDSVFDKIPIVPEKNEALIFGY